MDENSLCSYGYHYMLDSLDLLLVHCILLNTLKYIEIQVVIMTTYFTVCIVLS